MAASKESILQKLGAFWSDSIHTINQVTDRGENRQVDLTAIQAKIKDQINDLRNLLNASGNPLSREAKNELLGKLQYYENNHADFVLSKGIPYVDFHAKEAEWTKITSSATNLEPIYQALVISYNDALTAAIKDDKSNLPEIFLAKREVYKLCSQRTLASEVEKDKKVLTEWNNALTTQADTLFRNKVTLSPIVLDNIFNQKKLVAKYLYMLEKPTEQYIDAYFTPLNTAIDALKGYLINPTTGRYMNTKESTNWFGFGVTRTAKLEAALGYCDRIVLNVTGEPLVRTGRALTQGNLNTVVGTFSISLNGFFQQIRSPDTTSPTSSPTLQTQQLVIGEGSPSLSPSLTTHSLLLSGISGSSFSSQPSFSIAVFTQRITAIIERSDAVKTNDPSIAFLSILQGRLRSKIDTKNDCIERLSVLGQVFCLAPATMSDIGYVSEICDLWKQLVQKGYEGKSVPSSMVKFMNDLTVYSVKKYTEYTNETLAKRSKKLQLALWCFDLLSKADEPEMQLENYGTSTNKLYGDLDDNGLGKIVRTFIEERKAEKSNEQRLNPQLSDAAYLGQQKRVQQQNSAGNRVSSLFYNNKQ